MSETYAKEINWWKSRAAEFDSKRVRLQPLSYSYASQAYKSRNNLNGAASLDAMRLDIYKRADEESTILNSRIMDGTYVKPLTASEKKKQEAAAKPLPNTVVKPSESVVELDDKVDKLYKKIKGIGGDVTRTLVGGFSRAMDLLSRFDYAAQNIRADAIADAKASGGNITIGEHLQIAAMPFFMMAPTSGIIATAAIMGNDSARDMLSDGWAGLSGKKKVVGIDNIRAEFPNWSKEHNIAANVLGFASDVVSDPTTYLTMGSGTAVKTAGSVGARVVGQKALAKKLAEETIWTKAGRTAGTQTLKDNVRMAKTKPAAKAAAKAGKQSHKAAKQWEKGVKNFERKKITEEGLDNLKKRLGTAKAHQALAAAEYSRVHEAAFADNLLGFGDVAQYLIKHPFKSVGSYGQGLRAGGVAEGNKAAKAIHDGVKADFISEATKIDNASPMKDIQIQLRLFHANNAGRGLKAGTRSFVVNSDYEKFVADVAENLFKFVPVTQLTSRAARGRYSVLAQAKKERNEFVNLLLTGNNSFVDLVKYADNVLKPESPVGRKAAAAAAAAPAAPVTKTPTPTADPSAIEEAIFNVAVQRDMAIRAQAEQDVDGALNVILGSKTLRQEMMPDLFAARPPELIRTDELNGLSPDHIAAREYFKTIARQKMTDYGVQLDEAGIVAAPETRAVGDFAATGGVHQVNYTAMRDRAIAEALSDAMEEAVQTIAAHRMLNDPEVIVKSYVDAAHEMINKVSADTHVQVMEFMRYKHGLSMPSMNLPRNHVDDLYVNGDIWDGIPSPQYAEKHYAGYLTKQITDKLGGLDIPEAAIFPGDSGPLTNDFWYFMEALEAPKVFGTSGLKFEVRDLFVRLRDASNELARLHYTGPELSKAQGAVDKYNVLDHIVFGRGATEELKIGKGLAEKDPKIGRVAFASDSLNINGIPPYNAQLLGDLKKLDEAEEMVVEGYARMAREGYEYQIPPYGPTGIPPKSEEEIRAAFSQFRRWLARHDLKYVTKGTGAVDPQEMLHSLGSHLDLLHNTTEYGNFSVKWRRQMASNIWGIPAEKLTKGGAKEFKPGKWSSATLMADLNDAISLGILERTLKHKMTPEQVADWLAAKSNENPIIQMIMKDANIQSVRGGIVGAGYADPNMAQKIAAETHNPLDELDAEELRNMDGVAAAADPARPDVTPEGIAPGGFTAPQIQPENIKHIQAFIDKTYDEVDVVTLNQLMADMRSNYLSQILFYDQKMQEAMQNMQLQNSMQIRFMGMPIVSLPAANNPMHTNAGVLAMNQDLPKHLTARKKVDVDGNAARIFGHKWLTRPTSKLDEGMRQIHGKWSGESTFDLRFIMDNVKVTYRSFKNKAELRAATRDYFTVGANLDPRLVETEKRFNDIHDFIMEHAVEFTGKDTIGYDSNFVRGSVAAVMSNLPNEFRVPRNLIMSLESDFPLFSREWFSDLSSHLSHFKETNTHPLSVDNIKRLDMSRFEFGFQHTAAKLKVRNETAKTMFQTFTAPMDPSVVIMHNASDGIYKTRNVLVETEEFFGGNIVPEGLKGRYVTEHVAEEMRKIINFTEEAMDNRRQKLNFGYMRDLNNAWKSGVTVFSARYHVGNAMSDGFMNLIDGVRPESYKKAANTIFTDPDLAPLINDPTYTEAMRATFQEAGVDPEDLSFFNSTAEYMKSHGHSRPISMINIGGKPVTLTSAEYQLRYRGFGLDQNNVTGNLSRGTENMVSPGISQASRVSDVVQDASARREDYFRMAHFIHAVEQEARVPGRSLDEVFLAARDRVVQWHFDYDNVTEFERNFIAPVAPFYKWTRNIVPLSFAVYFTNPKAYTLGNAANRAMGEMFFPTQEDANGNEIPLDAVIPRWIVEQGAVPMETYLDPEGNQQMRYAVLNLPFDQAMVKWFSPFTDAATDPEASLSDKLIRKPGAALAGTALSMAHPMVQSGVSAATGVVPIPGGAIKQENWWDPMLNMLYSGFGAAGELVKAGNDITDPQNPYSIVKALGDTGAIRLRSVTDAQKKGELLRQEDRLQAILKQKAAPKWMAENYPGIDPNSDEGKKILHDHYVKLGILEK